MSYIKFSDLINDSDSRISQAATFVEQIKHSYEDGNLTEEQYNELVEDVLELDKVLTLADSLETKTALQKAFNTLRQLAGAIK